MPHIVAKSYKEFPTPIKKDGYEFLWFARGYRGAKDTLVAVRYEGHVFLLEIKQKEGNAFLLVTCNMAILFSLLQVTTAEKLPM